VNSKPCLYGRSAPSGTAEAWSSGAATKTRAYQTAEARRAQRRKQGREHSNRSPFSDRSPGRWTGLPLRFQRKPEKLGATPFSCLQSFCPLRALSISTFPIRGCPFGPPVSRPSAYSAYSAVLRALRTSAVSMEAPETKGNPFSCLQSFCPLPAFAPSLFLSLVPIRVYPCQSVAAIAYENIKHQ
jgi:hypothetical protein